MEFFRIKKDIPFMRHAKVLNIISMLTFVAAVIFIAVRGLHFSIEFTGGTVMEVSYPQAAPLTQVRKVVEDLGYADAQVQNFGTSRDLMIRLPLRAGQVSGGEAAAAKATNAQSEKVMAALKEATPGVTLRRVEFVGPQVGKEPAQCLRYCFDPAARPLWPSSKRIPGPGAAAGHVCCREGSAAGGMLSHPQLPTVRPGPQDTPAACSRRCRCAAPPPPNVPQATSRPASTAARRGSLSSRSCRRQAHELLSLVNGGRAVVSLGIRCLPARLRKLGGHPSPPPAPGCLRPFGSTLACFRHLAACRCCCRPPPIAADRAPGGAC